MKHVRLFCLVLFMNCGINAQDTTIISDSYIGIFRTLVSDTFNIDNIVPGSPADIGGLLGEDIVIEINGFKVSGAGLSLSEIDKYMGYRAGETVYFKVLRKGNDSLISLKITRGLDISREVLCHYEYLVDNAGHLNIHNILTDSINKLFLSPAENKILIYSVDKKSEAERIGLKSGDKIISSYSPIDLYGDMIEFTRKARHDTSIIIIRENKEIILKVNSGENPFSGVLSQSGYDFKKHCCWYKIVLNNQISEDRTYLMDFYPNDSISFYEVSGNEIITEKRSGRMIPEKEKDYPLKSNNFIKVNLIKNEKPTFYIRITNDDIGLWNPIITLIPLDYITRFDRIERFLLAALYGMMLILALYYLILFFYIKEKSYIFYFFFIISFGLALLNNSGYGDELIWRDSVYFFDKIGSILVALPFTFFLLFGISYLNFRSLKKVWYRLILLNLAILWVPLIIYTIRDFEGIQTYPLTGFGFDDVLELIMGIGSIIAAFILIAPSILRIRKGFKPAWHFLIANILLIAVIVYFGFSQGDNQGTSDITKAIYNANIHIGVAMQFLVFAFGLGSKMRTAEKEKKEAQERIIEQLQENEKLKDKVNRELEQKVRERTEEIFQQKEEIETQRDELEKKKDLLTIQKQEITDSINYAKKIQTAILPPPELLSEILPEHFILFKPRDIVSGDFYWIKQIKNFTIVAAVDCTGHGVPGAFMSILGMTLLNEQVSKSQFDHAGELLDRLRKKVKETLKQKGKDMEQKEGMDMALAIINNDTLELQFAGAYNPLYIIRKKNSHGKACSDLIALESEEYHLLEIKADRQPIGIYSEEKNFTTNYFQVHKSDTLYIFSDGYIDQLGGPREKKFLSRKFKETLLQIQDNSMVIQKTILNKTLEDWQGNLEQIDDILVFGIRWN
jgi:serine phosphatase RsbU (regulator of sigma subunit)